MKRPLIVSPAEKPPAVAATLERLARQPLVCLAMACFFVGLDLVIGPYIQFPATFVIPVAMAAWFCNRPLALALAVLQPATHMLISLWTERSALLGIPAELVVLNTVIRIAVLAVIAHFIAVAARQSRELTHRVGLLRGEIPICFDCKAVKDEHGEWQDVETYITQHTGAVFIHDACPACRSAIKARLAVSPGREATAAPARSNSD